MAEATLKMYRARTMADALAEVKRDLGKDAVILHTRAYRVGGLLGLGAKPMVEITASSGLPREPKPLPRGNAMRRAYGVPEPAAAARMEPAAAAIATEPEPAARPEPKAAGAQAVEGAALRPALEDEIHAIKRMMGQVLESSRRATGRAPAPSTDAIFTHYLRMLESEVAGELADDVVAKVRRELTEAELADETAVRQALLRHLAALVPVAGETPRPGRAADGRPTTIALIGPTGVGKTTTIAKLAAAYKLRQGKRIALVTSDTYRIAAVEQLRTYADIIGVPLRIAMTPEEMRAACEALRDHDLILIDTAGRSARDAARVDELRAFIAAADPHETHLVLSSASSERVLIETARRFARARPNRIIFTKLDEAVNYGVLLTVASRIALKLSFITTGQEVPDHIEPGRGDRLARLVLAAPAEVGA